MSLCPNVLFPIVGLFRSIEEDITQDLKLKMFFLVLLLYFFLIIKNYGKTFACPLSSQCVSINSVFIFLF